jgi:hypothetical protein
MGPGRRRCRNGEYRRREGEIIRGPRTWRMPRGRPADGTSAGTAGAERALAPRRRRRGRESAPSASRAAGHRHGQPGPRGGLGFPRGRQRRGRGGRARGGEEELTTEADEAGVRGRRTGRDGAGTGEGFAVVVGFLFGSARLRRPCATAPCFGRIFSFFFF